VAWEERPNAALNKFGLFIALFLPLFLPAVLTGGNSPENFLLCYM